MLSVALPSLAHLAAMGCDAAGGPPAAVPGMVAAAAAAEGDAAEKDVLTQPCGRRLSTELVMLNPFFPFGEVGNPSPPRPLILELSPCEA